MNTILLMAVLAASPTYLVRGEEVRLTAEQTELVKRAAAATSYLEAEKILDFHCRTKLGEESMICWAREGRPTLSDDAYWGLAKTGGHPAAPKRHGPEKVKEGMRKVWEQFTKSVWGLAPDGMHSYHCTVRRIGVFCSAILPKTASVDEFRRDDKAGKVVKLLGEVF